MESLIIPFNEAFNIIEKIPLYPYKNYYEVYANTFSFSAIQNIIEMLDDNNVNDEELREIFMKGNVIILNFKTILRLLMLRYSNIVTNDYLLETHNIKIYFTFNNEQYCAPLFNKHNFVQKGTRTLPYLKNYGDIPFKFFLEYIPFIIINNNHKPQLIFNSNYHYYDKIPKDLLLEERLKELSISELCIEFYYYIGFTVEDIIEYHINEDFAIMDSIFIDIVKEVV